MPSVARALAPTLPDGVFEVDLAALSDPALLAQHVAHVFGVKESAGGPVADNLAGFLRQKRLLLVLDNFEHLLSSAPLVTRLLEAAPALDFGQWLAPAVQSGLLVAAIALNEDMETPA